MATEVVMPQMGESIAEGTITKWLVKVGDKVERDQPLFEISTDKVDAEIPSPAAGVVVEIRHKEGETVPVSQVVAVIGGEGEKPAAGPAPAAAKAAAPASAAAQPAAQPAAPAGPEVAATVKLAEREEQARGDATPPAPAPSGPRPAPAPPAAAPGSVEERVRRYSSPLVRKMAQVEGVN
ncbi:MAG TPA: biotin/lipoyl-containing protein, partial [Thermoanaerobaculia bacterium]|nr:biotin/lipoyl-containing protein [Thermoanaerobaculia bacterium]